MRKLQNTSVGFVLAKNYQIENCHLIRSPDNTLDADIQHQKPEDEYHLVFEKVAPLGVVVHLQHLLLHLQLLLKS